MNADDLAKAVRELSDLAGSAPHTSLRRLVEFAAQAAPGCAGATSTFWRHGELVLMAATHPDLADLVDRQLARESGPVPDAIRAGAAVGCADTLAELDAPDAARRWPEFAEDALRYGIRCSATLVHSLDGMLVTLTLYGTKPRALDPAAVPAASLLAAVGGVSLANASQYDSSRRSAAELAGAISSRAVVDQARGLLMRALGCDADQAMAQLQHLAQARHVPVAEIAHWLIEERARGKDGSLPAPDDGPAIGPPGRAERRAVAPAQRPPEPGRRPPR